MDTDILSFYLRRGDQYRALRARIIVEINQTATSIITFEEHLHFVLPAVRRTLWTPKANDAYAQLSRFVSFMRSMPIVEYDGPAQAIYEAYPSNLKQAHRGDARIAAIARANGYTVVTNNTTDFDELGAANVNWTNG